MAKLVYYGGDGYGGQPENGAYKVKCTNPKLFNKLSEARKYYNSLNEGKALWAMKGLELLEAHTLENE